MESILLTSLTSALSQVPGLAVLTALVWMGLRYIQHRDSNLTIAIIANTEVMGQVREHLKRLNGGH